MGLEQRHIEHPDLISKRQRNQGSLEKWQRPSRGCGGGGGAVHDKLKHLLVPESKGLFKGRWRNGKQTQKPGRIWDKLNIKRCYSANTRLWNPLNKSGLHGSIQREINK